MGDIVEAGLSVAWADPSEAKEEFRERMERMIRAIERLDRLIPELRSAGEKTWVQEINAMWQSVRRRS